MVGEVTRKNLYDAATKGEIERLQQLLEEGPYLLNEVTFGCSRNLLHIATMQGQLGIVEVVLNINSQLAFDVDSRKASSLHIAAAKGNVEIAKRLLAIAPEICWWRDCHFMNPVHIAAMNGHVGVLKELLKIDLFPAMERLHRGQTVLHLCVKHGQLEALRTLVEKVDELVCAKDDDGETLMHLAVRCKQLEIIRDLVGSNKIEELTPNYMGKTALTILQESSNTHTTNDLQMEEMLIRLSNESMLKALPKVSDITMLVVVLIATMAFQAAVSPPGGFWQEDTASHRAGDATMASTHPTIYKYFVHANTTAFVSSLIAIFVLSTGLPYGHIFFLAVATYTMWVSLVAIAITFGASVMVSTPNTESESHNHIMMTVSFVCAMVLLFLGVWIFIVAYHLSPKSRQRRR